MTSSNFDACTTRQIRRLRTLEDAAGIDADLTPRIRQAGSVAHQPASFGHFTHRICRRSMRATPLSREKARGGVVIRTAAN